MKRLFYLVIAVICICTTGCEEEKAMLYEDFARVQFASTADDFPYSFIWLNKTQQTAVVKLPLSIIGGPQDVERKLRISQVEEFDIKYEYDSKGYIIDSTVTPVANPAVAGVHFVPFDDASAVELLKVDAGVVKDSLEIILKRDASLAEGKVRLRVRLEVSDDFFQGESKYLERTIVFSDMLEQPSGWWVKVYNYSWGVYYSGSVAYNYLGMYSVPKHELMIRVLQREQGANSKVDDEWINKGNADPTIFVYWRSKFVEELNAFNNNPDNIASGAAPLREDPDDPNSALISFPTKVQ